MLSKETVGTGSKRSSYERRVFICDVLQLHLDLAAEDIESLEEDPFVALSQYLIPEGGHIDGGYETVEEMPDEDELERRVAELPGILELFVHDGLISPEVHTIIAEELNLVQEPAPVSPDLEDLPVVSAQTLF